MEQFSVLADCRQAVNTAMGTWIGTTAATDFRHRMQNNDSILATC